MTFERSNFCYLGRRTNTWRHDSVLQVLQRHLTSFWKHVEREPSQVNAPFIRLVKEGAPRLPNQRRNTRPLLSDDVLRCARDWQFLFDVGTGYSIFPIDIAVTRQRPDIVIFSQSLRVVILIELTVPLEDRILHMQISAPFCFSCGRHLERSFAAAKLLAGHSVCLWCYASTRMWRWIIFFIFVDV